MKINNEELKILYNAYIKERIAPSRRDCPDTEEIINFFRSKLESDKQLIIIDHITNCSYCVKEFESIFHILKAQENLSEEIGGLIRSKNKEIEIKRKKYFSLFSSWKYALPFLGAAILITAFFIFRRSEKIEYRDQTIPKMNLVEPINGKHIKSLPAFKWTEIKNSEYYVLEIFDETLYPVFESDKIIKNHYILSEQSAKKIVKNKSYFWMVTAFMPDGKKIESNLEEFRLID